MSLVKSLSTLENCHLLTIFFLLFEKTYLSLKDKKDTTHQQKSIRDVYLGGEIERIDTIK